MSKRREGNGIDPAAELIDQVLEGDDSAFEQLYNFTIRKVYRTLYFLCGPERGDVEDIVQNVYLELYRCLPNYDRKSSFTAWLSGITLRQQKAYKRQKWKEQRRRERLYSDRMTGRIGGADRTSAPADEVREQLDQLSNKLRQVIVLHYLVDLTQQEVADLLGIPIGTVKSRINLALTRLREYGRRETDAQPGRADSVDSRKSGNH